jgi:hypothetical protein
MNRARNDEYLERSRRNPVAMTADFAVSGFCEAFDTDFAGNESYRS